MLIDMHRKGNWRAHAEVAELLTAHPNVASKLLFEVLAFDEPEALFEVNLLHDALILAVE